MAVRKLKILIVSAEVAPFAKVGGLADVAGSLPKALHALGHDVRVAMPCYRMIEENPSYPLEDVLPSFPVPIREGHTETASVKQTWICNHVPLYLIKSDRYFTEATESKKIYTLAPEPYIFFDRAVAEFVPRLSPAWTPDIVHCHDWHTGLVPVYIDTFFAQHPTWSQAGRVFTIHNLAHQGNWGFETLRAAGLPDYLFTYENLEFFGQMSFMKGGMVFSDMVNTVSKTYAKEIQTPEFGCHMEGLLRYLASQGRLTGIVNGIDYDLYDPATDPHIPAHYDAQNPAGKAKCRAALQEECGLPKSRTAAVLGIVSRLDNQKGFDLIRDIMPQLLKMPIQFILLGTGDPRHAKFFKEMEQKNPRKVKAHIGFDVSLAQRIYAGSDMFLMPSQFEPCGLGQMISLRYGTIPIVRATGGLADTITDFNPKTGKGIGFVFREYSPDALLEAIRRALEAFQDKEQWKGLIQRGMTTDYSWNSSARRYVDLYRQALSNLRLVAAA